MFKRNEKSADDFWTEYEKGTGEKVLARNLGKYIQGLDEFDSKKWNTIWGLIIATSGGLHFHHFPQQSWIQALTSFTGRDAPKEKTFFIQKENIISVRLIRETRWWKKILSSVPPVLMVDYRDEAGNEKQLLFEIDYYGPGNESGNIAEVPTEIAGGKDGSETDGKADGAKDSSGQ